jgi:shikimate dehydrogenase
MRSGVDPKAELMHGIAVTSATKLYGVIGWPIAHSLSPAMHNAAFSAMRFDARYCKFPVEPSALERALLGAAALGFGGLSVTMPHKEAALHLCEPDETARVVGAVNALRFEGGIVRGRNTDLDGLHALIEEAQVTRGGRAIVLGTGGAARAAVWALEARAFDVTVVSRARQRWQLHGRTYQCAPWHELPRLLHESDVLLDATPRGLDEGATPIDLTPLHPDAIILDLVVKHETRLVRDARARGLRAHTGKTMLLWQGVRAFEWWTNLPAPVEAMERALRVALAGL